MAKRRRLTPAKPDFLHLNPHAGQPRPPIAQVAGEAAAVSALSALSDEWEVARQEGRLIVNLPLEQIAPNYLDRDRIAVAEDEMEALSQSLMARGQQTPVEVIALEEGRYGLISGWRRYTALQSLQTKTGEERFDTIQAILRKPADLAASYVAMVEENEIRADLSFYERARIVARALEAGVFETEKQALNSLFGNATYAKRSKIKSFLPIVAALGDTLKYPAHLSERAGLALSKALTSDPEAKARLRAALDRTDRFSAEVELTCLMDALKPESPKLESKSEPNNDDAKSSDIAIAAKPGRIVLTGPGVTEELHQKLRTWLEL